MRIALRASALILVASVAGGAPALADCTDAAAPNVDWRRCYQDGQDLHGVDLTGAVLRDSSFANADLSESVLVGVNAYRAKFLSAKLPKVRLDDARLEDADFTKADLTGASLKNANLRRARFFGASLRGADLTGAHLAATDLLKADLSGARWTDGEKICAEGSIGKCN